MPQIGWFEILIIVFVAIILIGPKDFPMVLKKIGSWIGTAKRYVQNVQQQVSNLNEEDISLNDNNIKTEKKDEDKKSK
jgi:sec-independent protein translocase protein TatB